MVGRNAEWVLLPCMERRRKMRTLPILFKTEMVQALLAGRKSCTRRVIKFPDGMTGRPVGKAGDSSNPLGVMYPGGIKRPPYQLGDILYVRETWCSAYDGEKYFYIADKLTNREERLLLNYDDVKWHPSIHMPKDAARIWLKVTDVRVERLQEITEDQTEEEGFLFTPPCLHLTGENYCDIDGLCTSKIKYCDMGAGELFGKVLWNSTIKKTDLDRYGWDANPWVWVIEFERCEKPGKE